MTPGETSLDGTLARVVAGPGADGKWIFETINGGWFALGSEQTKALAPEVGDVLVAQVLENGGTSLTKVSPDLWRREDKVATVLLVGDKVIVEVGALRLSVSNPKGIELKAGYAVIVAAGIVTEVVSKTGLPRSESLDAGPIDPERFVETQADALTLDDFIGAPAARARASHFVRSMLEHRDQIVAMGGKPVRGVLLSGPPGTGKTHLARILASQTQAAFYAIDGPELFTKWYGETEQIIRALFDHARSQERAVIFFDEIDSLASRRNDQSHEASKRVVAQLLTEMDGFSADDSVVVLAATNRPDDLDPALRRAGRFDWEIHFSLPDDEGRKAMLEYTGNGVPGFESIDVSSVVVATAGWSQAEVSSIWTEAIMLAAMDGRQEVVPSDIDEAVVNKAAQRVRRGSKD